MTLKTMLCNSHYSQPIHLKGCFFLRFAAVESGRANRSPFLTKSSGVIKAKWSGCEAPGPVATPADGKQGARGVKGALTARDEAPHTHTH